MSICHRLELGAENHLDLPEERQVLLIAEIYLQRPNMEFLRGKKEVGIYKADMWSEEIMEGFLEEVTLNQLQGVPQEGVVDPGGEVGLSYTGDQFCDPVTVT